MSVRLRVVVSVGRVAGLVAALASCSYVPDAINPVEWYKGASDLISGGDRPEIASPRPVQGQFPDVNGAAKQQAQAEKPPADGLAGDSGHARYASPVRREVTPTKAFVRATPAPVAEETTVAAAPAPQAPTPAAPVPAAKPVAAPVPAPAPAPAQAVATVTSPNAQVQRQAIARAELGPSAPPAKAPDMTPPPPPNIPDRVGASAGAHGMRTMEAEYQRRLAESASPVIHPVAAASAPVSVAAASEPAIHLHPPRGGRGKGLAAPEPDAPAADSSFQVAALDFADANALLTSADRRTLADIAKLYRKTGGTIRILGHSPAGMAGAGDVGMERANAIAHELVRHGVPARRVMVAGAPMPWGGAPGAQVFLDY